MSLSVAAFAATAVPVSAAQEQAYDIPAQPLSRALAAFARISRVNIVADNALTADKSSSAVQGTLPPQVALHVLLSGTGLSSRFTGPEAAIIFEPGPAPEASLPHMSDGETGLPRLQLDTLEIQAPAIVGTEKPQLYQSYARRTVLDLTRLLNQDPYLKQQTYSLKVSVRVDSSGRVNTPAVLESSGDEARDRYICRFLSGKTVSPPPEGFTAPLNFRFVAYDTGKERP